MKIKYLIFSITVIMGMACSMNKEETRITLDSPVVLSDPSDYSQAVFLTKDKDDNPVIVWSSAASDSGKYILNFKKYDAVSASFSEISKIDKSKGMQAHHESMAKIGFKKNGDIVAVYRRENTASKRRFAGDLFYTESTDGGASWVAESKLVTDTTSGSQSFYDLARLGNGEIGITWLDSRKLEQKEGSSIFFNQTNSNGGFTKEKGIVGSTCQCCRTELQVDDLGKLNIAFRDIINDSIRDMVYVFSEDNGATFSKGKRISDDNWMIKGCPHTGPTIATNDTQRATAWFTMGGGKGVYFTSGESSMETSPSRKIIDKNATHPQMIWTKNHFYLTYELRSSVDGRAYRQIVVTLIDALGEIYKTINISDIGIDSQMPVITSINDKYLLIAWVDQHQENQSIVKAKILDLE